MIKIKKLPVIVPSNCKQNVFVSKRYIMNKNIYVLSSSKINRPIDKEGFISIDIHSTPFEEHSKRNYVIAFRNKEYLEFIRSQMKHPYLVSDVKIGDIAYYLQRCQEDLMIINNGVCDLKDKYATYTSVSVRSATLTDETLSYVPISLHNFHF